MDPLKKREVNVRRRAYRQGLLAVKSRRRDPRALDFGKWFIVDAQTNALLTSEWGIALEEVEEYLDAPADDREPLLAA